MALFATIKTFILLFAYFAAFQIGKMTERPKNLWPRAKTGQNPFLVGDWDLYQKIYYGVVGLAVLLTLIGGSGMGMGMGGMGGMFGGGGGGGYY
jgi:hypothetical protein